MKTNDNHKKVKLHFGRYQVYASEKMNRIPLTRFLIRHIWGYTNISGWIRSRVFKRLVRDLPLQDFQRIMDLGCGKGEYVMMMAEALPQCHFVALDVVDREIETVKRCREAAGFTNIELFLGTLDQYENSGPFDFIYSVDVFEHIVEDQMPFNGCYQRLRPGGYLLVKMPARVNMNVLPKRWFASNEEWVKREHPGQIYELPELVARMEQTGFEVKEAYYRDGFFSRLAWEVANLTKKGGSIPQLLFLPLVKLIAMCDGLLPESKYKNTIQVIGRKPQQQAE